MPSINSLNLNGQVYDIKNPKVEYRISFGFIEQDHLLNQLYISKLVDGNTVWSSHANPHRGTLTESLVAEMKEDLISVSGSTNNYARNRWNCFLFFGTHNDVFDYRPDLVPMSGIGSTSLAEMHYFSLNFFPDNNHMIEVLILEEGIEDNQAITAFRIYSTMKVENDGLYHGLFLIGSYNIPEEL